MQAIVTKIIPATNTKPTRLKASCARGSLYYSTTHLTVTIGDAKAHRMAAQALVDKFIAEDAKQYGTQSNSWSKPFATGEN